MVLNKIKRLAGLSGIFLGTILFLSGCSSITWEDMNGVLYNPRELVTEVGVRNQEIIDAYEVAGLLSEAQSDQLQQAIADYTNEVTTGSVANFAKEIKGCIVDVVTEKDDDEGGALYRDLPDGATADNVTVSCPFIDKLQHLDGITPKGDDCSAMNFEAKNFKETLVNRLNKQIYALKTDLQPEDFAGVVQACADAAANPASAESLGILEPYFENTHQTLSDFDMDDLYQDSEDLPGVNIGDKRDEAPNSINKHLYICGPVTYEWTEKGKDGKDDKEHSVTEARVLLIIKVSELSQEFQESVDIFSQTKNKYFVPDIAAANMQGGEATLSQQSRIYLMEYPVSVLDSIQLGTSGARDNVGSNRYAAIFKEEPNFKVNLMSGEMLYDGTVINKEAEAAERIYRLTTTVGGTGINGVDTVQADAYPSFAFHDDGGTSVNVQLDSVQQDIKLKGLYIDHTDDDSVLGTEVTSSAPDYVKNFPRFSPLTQYIDGGNGKKVRVFWGLSDTINTSGYDIPAGYVAFSEPGGDEPKYLMKAYQIDGSGPSLIEQSWTYSGSANAHAADIIAIRDEYGFDPAEPGDMYYNPPVSYTTTGPIDKRLGTATKATKVDLATLSAGWDYASLTPDPDTQTNCKVYYDYLIVEPSATNGHIEWDYVEYGGFTDIPTQEELDMADDAAAYNMFLSSPEMFNLARVLAGTDSSGNFDCSVTFIPNADKPNEEKTTCYCKAGTQKSLIYALAMTDKSTIWSYASLDGDDGPDTGKTVARDDVDISLLEKVDSEWVYTYNGVAYYCTSPIENEFNSATIILIDYLELTYLPNVVDNEPFIATGRRVRLLSPLEGTTNEGLDAKFAVFTDKSGKVIDSGNSSTAITIGDIIDRTSGTGFYEDVAEKLGLGATNSQEIQNELNKDPAARVEHLNTLYSNSGSSSSVVEDGLSADGMIEDAMLLKYSAYFNWVEPVMQFATTVNGNVPGLASVDANNTAAQKNKFWGICVNTDAFETHLYTNWIDVSGDGGEIGSLAWWNAWLTSGGYNYQIDLTKLMEAISEVYKIAISEKNNSIILNLETLEKVNEIIDNRHELDYLGTTTAIFKIIGVFLFSYGILLGLLWLIDVNLVNGPNFLTIATLGKLVAISDPLDFPEYAHDGKTYVTLAGLIKFVIGLWIFAAILIVAPVSNVWEWAMSFVQKVFDLFKGLMFNTL